MINAFKQIPKPLQKQILYRLSYGCTILAMAVVLLFYTTEFFSVLSCFFIAGFFLASSSALFRKAAISDYLLIHGECLGVFLTPVKKHTKMITRRT